MNRNIPIEISPYFWIVAVLLGWINSGSLLGIGIWIVVVFVSVLVHEYGHALTARSFGQEARIQLTPFGGLTSRSGGVLKSWQEFFIILNGPLAGFSLFLIASFILSFFPKENPSLLYYGLQVMMVVNIFWTILNLLPVLPLDGGQLLKVVLEGFLGFRGLKIAVLIGVILGFFLSIFFFLTQFFIAGVIFMMIAFENYRSWKELRNMTEKDMNPMWFNRIRIAEEKAKAGQVSEAIADLRLLREETKSGVLFDSATWALSRLLVGQGIIKEAYDLLFPLRDDLTPEQLLLLQQWAYRLQKWEEVVDIGQLAYGKKPIKEIAINNALASAVMGKKEPAIGWLRCSIQLGMPNKSDVLKMREFDVLRDSPEFQSL